MLPATVDPAQPAPLIVALHFGGYTPAHYGRIVAEQIVAPAFAELGAIVVAPDCPQGSWHSEPCEKTVLGLISHIKKSFPVDPRRIVITGYSMGGIGTWELSSRHPELFSAAIVMAGNPREGMADIDWQLPLYVIHAREDELMPLADTEKVVEAIRARGGQVELEILEGVSHFQTDQFVQPLRASVPWLLDIWEIAP